MARKCKLTPRETATVQHALRIYLSGIIDKSGAREHFGACEHFEAHRPLSDAETDALCERLGSTEEEGGDRHAHRQ